MNVDSPIATQMMGPNMKMKNNMNTTTNHQQPNSSRAPSTKGKPPPLTDAEGNPLTDEQQAVIVRDGVLSSYIASAIVPPNTVNPLAAKGYRETLLEEAGNPDDPIERQMIEILAVAHARVLRLHADAAGATDPQVEVAYNGAAARLTGEFRRLALALREYRSPISGKQTKIEHTVIHQQNVTSGQQEVSYVDAGEGGSRATCRDIEMNGKDKQKEGIVDVEDRLTPKEPSPRRRRQTQPAPAGALD